MFTVNEASFITIRDKLDRYSHTYHNGHCKAIKLSQAVLYLSIDKCTLYDRLVVSAEMKWEIQSGK